MGGAFWQDEHSALFHTDVFKGLEKIDDGTVDLVFTSPPYNLGTSTRTGGFAKVNNTRKPWTASRRDSSGAVVGLAHGYEANSDALPADEYKAWLQKVMGVLWTKLSPVGAMMVVHKPRVLNLKVTLPTSYIPVALEPYLRQVIVWDRRHGVNGTVGHFVSVHEWVMVIARPGFRLHSRQASTAGDVWTIGQDYATGYPGRVPLALPIRAIDATSAEVVMDPFCGSGSTLVAARRAGRYSLGIDNSMLAMTTSVTRLERTPWREPKSTVPRRCAWCNERFRPGRSDQRFCSNAHRLKSWRGEPGLTEGRGVEQPRRVRLLRGSLFLHSPE